MKIGGPAYGDPGGDFVPGMYLKKGYTITSRGCPNTCYFCFVHSREGRIRTLPINDGWIVQDNNLLACPEDHISAVFDMLEKQKRKVKFLGGLEASRLKDWHIERLCKIKLDLLFTAYDTASDRDFVKIAVERLRSAGITQGQIRCFVLCGFSGDTIEKAEERCQFVFDLGAVPFASYFRPLDATTAKKPPEWEKFTSRWAWMPGIFARIKRERSNDVVV